VTVDDEKLLDELADAVAKRRLTPAAVFFLESVKPLGWLGAQVMLFFRPIASVIWHEPLKWDQIQKILEERGAIDALLVRLEARY
jgi:hypothetical protein